MNKVEIFFEEFDFYDENRQFYEALYVLRLVARRR